MISKHGSNLLVTINNLSFSYKTFSSQSLKKKISFKKEINKEIKEDTMNSIVFSPDGAKVFSESQIFIKIFCHNSL